MKLLLNLLRTKKSLVKKGTKAKELIDKMEQYKMMRKYKIHENSAFIKEIEHYEQKIKECHEKLDELLGYNR